MSPVALEDVLCRPSLNRLSPRVLVDYTGVGRPCSTCSPVPGAAARHGPGWSVPKGELVNKLQALLHAGELRIAPQPARRADAPTRLRELQDFRVRFSDAGNATFNAREGAHDDLVLALALAVFGLSRPEPAREVDVVLGR